MESLFLPPVASSPLPSKRYELIGETGPEHDKQFHVEAYLNDVLIGTGAGRTKKAAEQQAAYEALVKMKSQNRK